MVQPRATAICAAASKRLSRVQIKRLSRQCGSSQQMRIDISDARSRQLSTGDEFQDLVDAGYDALRKGIQIADQLVGPKRAPKQQLAETKGA